MSEPSADRRVDVLVVGSGPCGMAVARRLLQDLPDSEILLVESGPAISERPGENIRNLPPEGRRRAYERSMLPSGQVSATSALPPTHGRIVARPGTHLVHPAPEGADDQEGMPAAAFSANVGGMGAHWTCACPRPGDTERINFIPDVEMDRLLDEAESMLAVTTTAFEKNPASESVLSALGKAYPASARTPQPMPLACRPRNGALPLWSGANTVLGPFGESLQVQAETVCVRLLLDGDRIVGAELRNARSGSVEGVAARFVVVAADALRTPQLLWASGLRHEALGRYLNDQPQIVAPAYVDTTDTAAERGSDSSAAPEKADARDALTGVCWVPFSSERPFHGQVMQLDTSPIAIDGADRQDPRPVVGLGWFTTKEIRREDRVAFDDVEVDSFGMPAMTIHYSLTAADIAATQAAVAEIERVAAEIGELVPGTAPILLPAGSSLHYQGTVRMGPANDGTSVCDPSGEVWGVEGLFVAGNGVIPTATACNPTLTSVALAIRSAERIVAALQA